MASDDPYKLFLWLKGMGKSLKLKKKQLAIMFSLREQVYFSHLNYAHLVGGLQLWVNVLWFLDTIVHSPAEHNHYLLAKGHDWVLQAFNNLL